MSLNKYVFFLVDLVALSSLVEMFREQELQQADHVMDVVEVIHGLTALYEKLEEERSVLVNIPLCVDMCLNWLLNVYDRWVGWKNQKWNIYLNVLVLRTAAGICVCISASLL